MENKMSESDVTFDEKHSASLFSNENLSTNLNTDIANSDSDSMSIYINEPELSDDIPEWKGMSMNEIRKGCGIYEYQEHPPIVSSAKHTVLFRLPLSMHEPPKPYPTHKIDKWSHGYVRLPCSAHCFYPVEQRSGDRNCRNRWDMIQEALLRNILSSQQLENAILSYNQIYAQRWNFAALHHFFSEVLDPEETAVFFKTLMPKIIQLALQLPILLTGAIPLLKRHTNSFISLSQLQVASLLANAFFCTFPRRNSSNPQSEYATYPYINFNRLFAAYSEEKHNQCESVMEKIKCLLHYFRRVTAKAPEGVITIERRYIPRENFPKWNIQNQKLPPLHITSKGTIENEGAGLLQVDFANKYVGGGVLGLGCVQEEIRFVICPELMVTMLVTEELDDTEALIVSGIERYSKYEGYSNTFKWKGDFVDETPRDDSCRRMTSIVAIDALYFRQPLLQFKIDNITRELNKAYVGFVGSDIYKNNLSAIATGNWGCGAFRGNPKLKVLIQLMAAAVAGRSMVYFTFGDTLLRDDVAAMYAHLVQHDIDIARLYSMISEYHQESAASSDHSDFYCFLYNKSRIKPLNKYFPTNSKNSLADIFAKDMLSQRSKNVALNKDVFNKHLYEMTEEEKIINWLASCDDDSDDNAKLNTKNACNEKTKSNLKEANNVIESLHFVNDIGENKNQEDKVFGSSPSGDMNEKFWDILAFTQQVSRLMVSEIRRRASNQSTETASCAIVKFLEIENSEESSNGWMLLSALNLLAAGDTSLIQAMTAASVPSTLVKCLYLFFDLPEMNEEEADITDTNSEFTPRERRILLQKIFVQLLVRLCSHPYPAEELARKDDLTLLFSAITSWCPQYNIMWRKSAAEVLMTLSRHGLTQNVVAYIHNKGCIALCIDNMQRVPELAPLEVVEMFVTVFCFLKDSSEVSQTLLDDFRACQGYIFLSEFLLKHAPSRLEQDGRAEAQDAIRNLVLMLASLTMCGHTELKPSQASMGSLFQMLGFTLPQPSNRGGSVRNIQAFQVLQSVFIKSNSPLLCCTILDAISSVYHSDNANYFILEGQNTLSQFAEKIHLKNPEIQEKFFQLLEFIVFQLNFVPCKELISLSILLKTNNSISCCIMCMETLLNILRHNTIFKDVYREVGMLEVFVTCLHRYATLLKDKQAAIDQGLEYTLCPEDERLGALVMEALTTLLASNVQNANVFRECGGARCAHNLVPYVDCRYQALGIVRELILSAGGDDDMATLLGVMHSAPPNALILKTHILKSLLACLRESHRTRTVFRKVGGFVYVMSVLVSLESQLGSQRSEKSEPCNDFVQRTMQDESQLLTLLHVVFHTISTAMRFEPANAKFFHHEICQSSLCDTLRLLGCFSTQTKITEMDMIPTVNYHNMLVSLFTGSVLEPVFSDDMPKTLGYACLLLRLLYDVALDSFDKPNLANVGIRSPSHKQNSVEQQRSFDSPGSSKRCIINSLNLSPPAPEPIVVHPGIVVGMLHLLPSISEPSNPQMALALQLYVAEIVKSLVRSERNQQVMCEAGMAGELLSVGRIALQDETHPLHQPLQYIIERLAAQSLEPRDLREFLRLGDPLCCISLDDIDQSKPRGGPVPLTRIKTLVSMTTPKDFRAHGSCTLPPFVELDMSAEGFACLYLPSVAPQSTTPPTVVSADNSVLGGIGSGDRLFPPQTGLTYSTWICVDKFSDPRTDPHCVRLLTLVRTPQSARDLICLTAVLSARDKAIIVSTQETPIPQNTGEWEPEGTGECGARVWCPDLLHEGQWHHIAIVLNRAVLKNSSFSLYLDGQHIHSQKLHYITQVPGGGAANLTVASPVYGYIGTPPCWRRYSRLTWKQGPCHLVEEVFNSQNIATLFKLGPHYMGSLQAPQLSGPEALGPLVAEEKVVFGLNAKAMSQLTLAKIRKVYSRADNKSIAKQLGMSSHENATPIRVLHNSAGHLSGPARALGGVVVGYLGVRVFSPKPVATMIDNVGGCSVLLGLIAMAQDVESLYAAVKALVCVVRSNQAAQQEMDRRRGYQTLAMLLRRKCPLLNSHILHLTFSLVGTVDSGRETSAIPNVTAFQDLLCDLQVWHEAPGELLRSLLEHLYELIAESSEKRTNLRLMRDLQLVHKLLHILSDVKLNSTRQILLALLSILLSQPRQADLLWFGQFIVATLPQCSEKHLILREGEGIKDGEGESILLRNRCLQLLHSLLFNGSKVNVNMCEEVAKVLGLDWVLLFLQSDLHSTTVVWGLRILVAICSVQSILQKFKEGTSNGGWLRHTDHNKMALALGCHQQMSTGEIKPSGLHVPGFQHLGWLLPQHIDLVPELYFLFIALMMGQPVKLLPTDSKLDLDNVWSFMFGVPANHTLSSFTSRINLCPEAMVTLLAMVRTMLNSHSNNPEVLPAWLNDYPVTIIQFLFFLYRNFTDFMQVFMSAEVLGALAGTLFPKPVSSSQDSSGASTPADEQEPVLVRSPSKDVGLTNHPAKKFVMDFFKVIVVDSLSLPVTAKSPAIDLVLEAWPEHASTGQQMRYQTEVLSILMEHLLAADVLIGEQAALPVVPGGSANNITNNVCYVAARIVDKLWQGALTKDPHEVFDFIVKLIGQAKRRPGAVSMEGLHHCLNRTILFLLSRATDSIADQMAVLEALHKLTTHRLLVFGAGNHELEFIGCLTYCLLQLTADIKIMLDTNMKTTWHVNPQVESSDDRLTSHQGHNLMAVAATRVWEELYVCKKPAIEEVFKMTLPAPVSNERAPELSVVREQIHEAASKLWLNYVVSERRATYRAPWELHNQIQSKIQKVTGGLTRLASRTKVRKEESVRVRLRLHQNTVAQWTEQHVALVRELAAVRRLQHQQTNLHTQRYVYQEWLQTETELTRERGLWGPPTPTMLDKWMLDMTEGPCRMRKKMMKNELFYIHYPYRPELEHPDNKQLKYKVATSMDSKEYYLKQLGNSSGMFERERDPVIDDTPLNVNETSTESEPPMVPCTLERHASEPDEAPEDNEQEEENNQAVPDNQTLLRLLEEHEKISHMFRCARIQGLDTTEGLLLFGKEHFYVIDGFTLLKSREIRDIESLPEAYEPILPSPGSPRRSRAMRQCSKFNYEDIREVHKRRYLLQPMALEVFSGDGRNYLLAFPRKVRNKVYQRFMTFATAIADNAQQSVAGQRRTANVEQATGLLSNLIGETSVTQRWVRGEISNFQYLMHLNTLAGRSYNDLMQYPIFPWILADYDSEELDLIDSSTFRDFSKPMGAQSPERLLQFKKRYKEWDDPHGETPPYHYGTHYSSAMIVCSYLVRMEPFTQHFLRLQGGHFDLADRMFNSIKEAWLSASKHNMADVKELIPEFFYLPEFLNNSNHFDLGSKQSGVQLGDIVLPPWAKQDPREFIRVHRLALECDYVSQHLHQWIDLIFGCKQNGPAAVEAVNVFHHLFYEGNVDIYNIDDPLKKNATIGFINNFGQIPKQLFKKPHPAKKMTQRTSVIDPGPITPGLSITTSDKLFFHNLDNLKPSLQPIKELKGPVGQILHVDKAVLAVEQNKTLIPPAYNKYVAWGFADHSLRIGNYDSDKAIFVGEALMQSSGEIVACVCPSSKLIVTAGTSSVVTVWEYAKRQLSIKQCLYGHTDAVTCLSSSPAYNVIVSGSRDGTAIIWDLSRCLFVRQLRGHAGPVAAVAINELTGDIATCAATWLHVWSINGEELASVNTCVGRADRMQQILCVAFSQTHEWDSQNVIMTGSTDGVARMWSMDYVQVPAEEEKPEEVTVVEKEKNEKQSTEENQTETTMKRVQELVKQMSISAEGSGILMKSGSESSLSETENAKEASRLHEEKEECSDNESSNGSSNKPSPQNNHASLVVLRRKSRGNPMFRKSEGGGRADSEGTQTSESTSNPGDSEGALRASKSDTSLTDSFVMVSEADTKPRKINPQNILRDGFKWQRQLVFRSKLTMHTAYDRKDNAEPASIAALAVSRDHRTVYVGDTRGRVFSWSVCEQPGRTVADHWLKDEGADSCVGCGVRFNLYERRHHCRNCGQVFCSRCSRFESKISRLGILKPVRVCQGCYSSLRSQSNSIESNI
ncbi:WD repeat and FYVE domain-containing protein 3 isoform X2 [Formica exsecta]|uniref:WD repeat and FYVE domain-containing protein 3 isoform X2 n=2 Tax=Formica exsecta TaxID=72781 RepID=UPI001144D643|nr:WD repeat and FYVE domain-containing protein 3 isoform X2 [Formica exsecta]